MAGDGNQSVLHESQGEQSSGIVCANCKSPLQGRWCHECGQDSRDPVGDFSTLAAEFFDSIIGWDSRLVRTLAALVRDPYTLTQVFISGQRRLYLGPVRLYVTTSILQFATFGLAYDPLLASILELDDAARVMAVTEPVEQILPTVLILLLPMWTLAMHAVFRGRHVPLLSTQILILHWGAFTMLSLTLGHLLAFSAMLADASRLAGAAIVVSHGMNAYHLTTMAARHFNTDYPQTMLRLLGFGVVVVVSMWAGALVAGRLAA